MFRGWQKLIAWTGNTAEPIADSSIHQLKNPPSPQSPKIPLKSSKIPNFAFQTTYRTPYRQNQTKSILLVLSNPIFEKFISLKILSKN